MPIFDSLTEVFQETTFCSYWHFFQTLKPNVVLTAQNMGKTLFFQRVLDLNLAAIKRSLTRDFRF
jgi:hypothetical protein